MEIISQIPKDLSSFLLVVLFSLLIGLEQRRLHIELEFESLFGTDRTITLIGILGFILYIVMPENLALFFAGGFVLSAFLGIYYFNKIKIKNQWGFTSLIIALITYCLTPLVYLQPPWMVMLIVVTILIVVEMKESLFQFSKKFDRNEFTTLAKFIVIAGIVLPLLPNDPISKWINISAYQIWLSIVAVSSISYFSYLLKNQERIRAIVLTHGHMDHIGGLPYLLRQVKTTVYGTDLTIGMVKRQLEEARVLQQAQLQVVGNKDTFQLGPFKVSLFKPFENSCVPFTVNTNAAIFYKKFQQLVF